MSVMHGQEASRRLLCEGVSYSYCMCERPRGLSGDCAMSVMRGEEASGMKLHEVVLRAPCLSACLPLLCSSVAGPSLICLSAVALFVCRWSIVGLSLVYHWSITGLSVRVMVVALFVCHWPVTILSLVCLLGTWPLVRVADRAPLVRHSSACSSFCWSVGRPSLICLLES